MAGQDLNRSIKIFIDGSEAAQGIEPVKKAIADLEAKLGKLTGQEADYEEKSKQLKEQLESKNRTLHNYEKKVQETDRVLKNLSGATYQELLAVRKQIRQSLENEVRGTEKYNVALEQNRRVSEEISRAQKAMRVEVGCNANLFGRLANGINKYAGLVTTSVLALGGITTTMRGAVQAYADMEEAESQVRKYTGMTTEQVKELNEELKKMDTRTARDKLNALAGDAGRLGITAKQDVLDFVDAADKINVALGEDLGEDAVANIGKLAQMFGEDNRMGLRGAMLATGSAINEVAQNSSAAEAYLVEFTARVAGVAHQAGISQADILGFAASMDENMLRNETSATAYQNILLKMMTDTEKFAKVAGLNVQEFAKLVRTDANEALLTFASALQKKGGMADLAPLFGDLKTEGAGVASMLAVLAGKSEEVRSRQELANQAYQDGTSILNEFNVQNTTVQAGLDKAKKGFNEVAIQLGEKLQPVMQYTISSTSMMMRGMNTLISVLIDNKEAVLLTTTAIVGYTVAVNASVVADKAKVLWTGKVTTGVKTLYSTLRKHPWGLVVAGASALVGMLIKMKKEQDALTEQDKSLNHIKEVTTKRYQDEAAEVLKLNNLIHNENTANEIRIKAINRLKEIIPSYNGMLSDEGKLINDNKSAIDSYLESLEKKIRLQAAEEELAELFKKKRAAENRLPDELEREQTARRNLSAAEFVASNRSQQASTSGSRLLMGGLDQGVKTMETEFNKAKDAVIKTKTELKEVEEAIAKINQEIAAGGLLEVNGDTSTGRDEGGNGSSGNGLSNESSEKLDALKAAIAAENELYAQQRIELKEAYINQTDEQLSSYELFKEAEEQLEMAHLQRTLEIAGLDKDARIKIEEQLLDFKLKCQKEFEDAQKKGSLKQQKTDKKDSKIMEAEYKKRFGTMKGYADEFGSAVGQVLSGQKNALEAFGDVMIDVVFDVLDQMIQAKLNELAMSAAAATAEGTMKEISSKGIIGIGTSAMITAAVSGLLTAAKSALKGLLGKRPSRTGGNAGSTSGNVSHRVAVSQHAAGKYDVIGADDGQTYRGVPYLGTPESGIITRPALISEQGGELIINAEDLRRLQQHINYPLVLEAIADVRKGSTATRTVNQYASGKYSEISMSDNPAATSDVLGELAAVLKQLSEYGIPASVVLSDLERKKKMRDRARRIGSKNRKKNQL